LTIPSPALPVFEDLGHGLTAIDTGFERPLFDASHLIVERGRAAFVDVGTNHSIPGILAVLAHKGLAPEAVDWVVLTHVHLDHAGGAGEIMRRLPKARLVVHPRGARHMIDPSALMAGASEVYGEDVVRRTYGQLLPVPKERVVEAPEGFTFELAGRPLHCVDTPGHARHHICIWDEASRSWFTGDTFGLAYREFRSPRGTFIIPTTTPVQFEPDALKASIDRLVARQPAAMLLTHFTRVTEIERLAADLHAQLDALTAMARAADGQADRQQRLEQGVAEIFLGRAREHGSPLAPAEARRLLDLDVRLNAQGLAIWLDRGKR
jgi:glyoxylase-like metal-dependent hydrolase (beta-lactamase superfamily II)